jgi:hypothetical protein
METPLVHGRAVGACPKLIKRKRPQVLRFHAQQFFREINSSEI